MPVPAEPVRDDLPSHGGKAAIVRESCFFKRRLLVWIEAHPDWVCFSHSQRIAKAATENNIVVALCCLASYGRATV